jgi:hypothetical protein
MIVIIMLSIIGRAIRRTYSLPVGRRCGSWDPSPQSGGPSLVTVVVQWCYSGVTVVSQWCHSGVKEVSQWCYSGVTVSAGHRTHLRRAVVRACVTVVLR